MGKVTVADSAHAALDALRSGAADVAFVYTFDLAGQSGVESFYEVPISLYSLRPNYKGAVLDRSEHKDAARWYLNIIYRMI